MPVAAEGATVTAVIPAYNAERHVAHAIESCLRQTHPPLEIIVVDDGSTDNTADACSRFGPQVRVIRKPNGGPASARNRGVADARGDWIALLDADDWWLPTKLEKQLTFVTASNVGLVHCLLDHRIDRRPPPVLSFDDLWSRNWIVNSSVLLRRTTFEAVGGFDEAEQLISVEDYNLWLRIAASDWAIVTCPEILLHYTQGIGISSNSARFMAASLYNVDVLEVSLALPASQAQAKRTNILAEFGRQALYQREIGLARRLLWRSFTARPAVDVAVYLAAAHLPRMVLDLKRKAGWRMWVRSDARNEARLSTAQISPSPSDIYSSSDRVNGCGPRELAHLPASASIIDARFHRPICFPGEQRPLLVTTVDAEEDFDWTKPFVRTVTDVRSMAHQHLAHAVFERYGVSPVYLMDYPVANQTDGHAPLADYVKDNKCEIGAQLHPWVNPPFLEEINTVNSFPGNLPLPLEFEKLRILTETIEDRLGVCPRVYRAGRYGVGRRTADILRRLGYRIDTSVVPQRSFAYQGGPDFFGFPVNPYWTDAECSLLEMPVTAGIVGALARPAIRLGRQLFRSDNRRSLAAAVLARTRTAEQIRLTPEGITIDEAKRLVRAMLARGLRVFTLSYHSPSLVPGSTPYVRTLEDRDRFLGWLDQFYDFFFGEIGGLPTTSGNVYDLAVSRTPRSDSRRGGLPFAADDKTKMGFEQDLV
jgi:glycosyltransferase involved in cell wall biosynthesis